VAAATWMTCLTLFGVWARTLCRLFKGGDGEGRIKSTRPDAKSK